MINISLIGTYQLVSWENRHASGKVSYPLGPDAQGFISYTPDGYMFVHLMARNRQPHALDDLFGGKPAELQRSATSHLSYCGRFELDGNDVIHHASVCSYPNWVDTQQRRALKFHDGKLQLSAYGVRLGSETVDAHLVWQRVADQ